MTIKGLNSRLKKMNTNNIIDETMKENLDALEAKNRDQLLAGKNRSGDDIFPTYLQDPYFKTPQAAQRYSDWKDKITPGHGRKSGVPNLYITGQYHKSRNISISGDVIHYEATFLGPEIDKKYGSQVAGLGGDFKKEFISETLRPTLNKKITNAIGVKFGK